MTAKWAVCHALHQLVHGARKKWDTYGSGCGLNLQHTGLLQDKMAGGFWPPNVRCCLAAIAQKSFSSSHRAAISTWDDDVARSKQRRVTEDHEAFHSWLQEKPPRMSEWATLLNIIFKTWNVPNCDGSISSNGSTSRKCGKDRQPHGSKLKLGSSGF